MIASVIFAPTERLGIELREACGRCDDLCVYKVLRRYPAEYHVMPLMNVLTPDIVFVEIDGSRNSLNVLREIQTCFPRTAIIGFAERIEKEQAEGSSPGVVEILVPPFTGEKVQQAIVHALEFQRSAVPDNIFAFLPAKAGSGSTTTAVHTAGYLARYWRQKVLLMEGDIHSGPVPFLLNLQPEYSIIDALENCSWLDDSSWSQLVSKVEGFDLLAAPRPNGIARILQGNCRRLLTFVRCRYDTVIVDLPEVVNDATEAIVTQAKRVYIVCTPEKPSVLLARARLYALKDRGVKDERIVILLNRHADWDLEIAEIEKNIGRHVSFVLPNDYPGLPQAMLEARLIDAGTKLGRAFFSFARRLTSADPACPPPVRQTWLSGLFRKLAPQHS